MNQSALVRNPQFRHLAGESISALLGMPVIAGNTIRHNGTCIEINPEDIEAYRPLFVEGSLATLGMFGDDYMLQVRLGISQTWIVMTLGRGERGEDEEPELAEAWIDAKHPSTCAHPLRESYSTDQIDKVATMIALQEWYTPVARKPELRHEFARPYVYEHLDVKADEQTIHWVARAASDIWEFAVIPYRVQKLSAAGKKKGEIARALNITTARVDRSQAWKVNPQHLERIRVAETTI